MATCGEEALNARKRTRNCNNPPPSNSGLNCEGTSKQIDKCPGFQAICHRGEHLCFVRAMFVIGHLTQLTVLGVHGRNGIHALVVMKAQVNKQTSEQGNATAPPQPRQK